MDYLSTQNIPYYRHSFTPGSKPTSSSNLSYHRVSSGVTTDSMDFMTGPFLLSFSVFVFSFLHYSYCFCCISMRLNKLATHQLLGARKYSLSYRIMRNSPFTCARTKHDRRLPMDCRCHRNISQCRRTPDCQSTQRSALFRHASRLDEDISLGRIPDGGWNRPVLQVNEEADG